MEQAQIDVCKLALAHWNHKGPVDPEWDDAHDRMAELVKQHEAAAAQAC